MPHARSDQHADDRARVVSVGGLSDDGESFDVELNLQA
jgi:hypothetical protein